MELPSKAKSSVVPACTHAGASTALHPVLQPEFRFPLAAEHAQGESRLAEGQFAVLDQPQIDADRLVEGDSHAFEAAALQCGGQAGEVLRRGRFATQVVANQQSRRTTPPAL